MTKQVLLTSGGRLLQQALRLKAEYERNNVPSLQALQKIYGETTERWASGVAAYERLTILARDDVARLEQVGAERREKYAGAIKSVASLVKPAQFHIKTADLLQGAFSELVIERLEALEETQRAQGLGITIETIRAEAVAENLRLILEEMAAEATSEIDDFIRQKLLELQFVLKNYALYGPDGVQYAVDVILGGGLTRAAAEGNRLPEPATNRLKRVAAVAKGALDAYVYAVTAVQAVEWTEGLVKSIGNWMSTAA